MIEIKHLSKTFGVSGGTVDALKDITLTIPDGEIYGIIGMSGAGKSTLVRCINMLERPTSGEVLIDGKSMTELSQRELREKRRDITMIFQGFNLLMQRNCLKNVCFPLELAGVKKAEAEKRAAELLELVGLGDKFKSYPAQLSGGQQQRVAIARDIHDRLGITVIIITHQMSVVEQICTRVAILDGGEVAEEGAVSDVFSSPKSEAAKRLVYPEGYQNPVMSGEDGAVIRVVFNGANATETPLIAKMAIEENIAASILSASTRSIGDKAYGNMLLGISGGKEQTQRALDYLGSIPDIFVEEVKQ